MSQANSTARQSPSCFRHLITVTSCIWGVCVATGTTLLISHANRPGPSPAAPRQIDVTWRQSHEPFLLMMFVHPQCPCTAASLSELERLLARCGSDVRANVYFQRPLTEADSWVRGRLWDFAIAIPSVDVHVDAGGVMASQFGSVTSGTVLLYDYEGRLRYQGGLTPARGHEGDNLGKTSILAMIQGERDYVECSPVFGCDLPSASEPASNRGGSDL